MKSNAYIFLGRSGAGKGTQAKLLIEYLKQNHPEDGVLRIESGSLLRDFAKGDSYTQKLIAESLDTGALVPEATIVALWTKYLADNYTGKEHLVFDGCPRKIQEAMLLDILLRFYKIEQPNLIYINVSENWSEKRLLERGRKDDTKEVIARRMEWFETEVKPSIEFFEKDKYYNFLTINGEQTIDAVHREVLDKLGLK